MAFFPMANSFYSFYSGGKFASSSRLIRLLTVSYSYPLLAFFLPCELFVIRFSNILNVHLLSILNSFLPCSFSPLSLSLAVHARLLPA